MTVKLNKHNTGWCPCIICNRATDCEAECLNFKRYVEINSNKLREKRFHEFKEKQSQGIYTI